MKKSKSGYILILVVTLLPILMLGIKYLLDIQILWNRKTSGTEFLKNNSSRLIEKNVEKTKFKVSKTSKAIEPVSSKKNLQQKPKKKEKNCAKEAALKVAEKWNPTLTYKQQKQSLLRIADGIYNGAPTYVETLLNKAIPHMDIARETIKKGGKFSPLQVIKTADTIQEDSEKQIAYKQIIFKKVKHNYSKYSRYDTEAAAHYYDDIHNFLLKKDLSIILPDEDVIDCYSKGDSKNSWEMGWSHYEFLPEEEWRRMNLRELKKVETKIYDVRKFPDDSAVQIECENDKVKVMTDKDIGFAIPAECNVDIILTVPTNIEALDIEEGTARLTNKGQSTPIYQITRAYRKFLKDHFFYTRGVTVGVIPYGANTTEKLSETERNQAINSFQKQYFSNLSSNNSSHSQSNDPTLNMMDANTPIYRNYGGRNINPYYVLKLTSNVKMIYEMLGAFYPYVAEKNYSNFIFVPIMMTYNLLQRGNAFENQPAIDTKYDFRRENSTYGRLRTPSSAGPNRKKVLILTVNKPDWFDITKSINLDMEKAKNLTDYEVPDMGKKITLNFCSKLKNTWGNNLRIYLIKFRKQNKCRDESTNMEKNFDYSYLNNCATEDTNQYVKDNILNQSELEEALRVIACDIKSWAEYTEAKNIY